MIAGFDAADNLGVDVERLGNLDDLLSFFGWEINLQTVTHVEDLVHLLPIGARLLVDSTEQGWDREEVVLDDVQVLDEMQHLGLRTARTMYHAVDVMAHGIEHLLDYGSVGAGWA